jgi:hypothetical protein
MQSLTVLTEQEIRAEELAGRCGYLALARSMRLAFNLVATDELETAVARHIDLAVRCSAMPRPPLPPPRAWRFVAAPPAVWPAGNGKWE